MQSAWNVSANKIHNAFYAHARIKHFMDAWIDVQCSMFNVALKSVEDEKQNSF